MSRLVLNAGAPAARNGGGGSAGAEAGEDLAGAMLRAVGAHMTEAGRLDYAALQPSAEFAQAEACAARLARVELDRLRRRSYRIGGHVFSLDEIEHGILRGNRRRALPPWRPFGRRDPRRALAIDPIDPRIHFALNCAAASCPPVGVYRAEVVDGQLDVAARSFLNQEVTLDEHGRVTCSRILKWYGRDFGSPAMLAEFLGRHLDDGPVKSALAGGAAPCRVYRAY